MDYIIEDGKVRKIGAKELGQRMADPLREGIATYADKKLAERVAEVGERAAFHEHSQRLLGMSDEEYGRYAAGAQLPDEHAATVARQLTGRETS